MPTTTLPQRYFVSPEVFAEEECTIFGRQWLCVGHQSQLGQSGDYFTAEVAGESLILVRVAYEYALHLVLQG